MHFSKKTFITLYRGLVFSVAIVAVIATSVAKTSIKAGTYNVSSDCAGSERQGILTFSDILSGG